MMLKNEVTFLIDGICDYLTNKIKNKMPDVDEERGEVINYGLHLVIGELPKNLILLGIAYILGVFTLTLLAIIAISAYRACSGGFHLKTHIGCMMATIVLYIGTVEVSKFVIFGSDLIKYVFVASVWIFSMCMIKLYAPADTEYVPILRKKERKTKKILSYITMTITLIIGIIITDSIISNIFIFITLAQTISISRFTYKISGCKYGHEVHNLT